MPNRTWEAETILRSVAEGSLKFSYLVSSLQGFVNRYREYAEALPDIAVLRSHERARELIELSGDPNAPQLQPYRELLVPQDRLDLLRLQYPRDVRGKIEQASKPAFLCDSLPQIQSACSLTLSSTAHFFSASPATNLCA